MDPRPLADATARFLSRLTLLVVVVAGTALLVSAAVVPAVVTADAAVDSVEREYFDHPPLPDELPSAPRVTHVEDTHGEVMAEVHGPVEREPVPLDEVADVLTDAVIATEDADFYEHDGVDHQSIVRAGLRNVQAGGISQGASTITQQLVTMALLDPEQTIERKLREIVWSIELEQRLSKDEILERYLNRVYLGNGVYGVATAADYYFSKPVGELELGEAAILAGAIRAPTANNPVDDPQAAARRRDIVVRQMRAQGRVTEAEAEQVLGTEVAVDLREEEPGQPFWEDLVKRVIYDPDVALQPGLQEAVGDSVDERVDMLFEGGLTITTTFDREVHDQATATLADYVEDPAADPLASLISLDAGTGAVRAMALGPKEFGPCDASQDGPCATTQVNPAVPGIGGSGRQSGSSFKPFVAATALAQGEDTDTSYDAPSGEPIEGCGEIDDQYDPQNYGGQDLGELDMTEATRRSANVYYAKLTRDVGVTSVLQMAHDHGLDRSIDPEGFGERSCSVGLGTLDVFPLEMVAGYAVWANDGRGCDPYLVERITDRDGEVLYEHEPDCERVVEPGLAATVRDLLRGPVSAGGTAPVVGFRVPDAFGKTGTTSDYRDAWFVGGARGHTTAAWIGYEQPRPMENVTIGGQWYSSVTGGSLPAPMWADFVSQLPAE